jgi:hypothetical protein
MKRIAAPVLAASAGAAENSLPLHTYPGARPGQTTSIEQPLGGVSSSEHESTRLCRLTGGATEANEPKLAPPPTSELRKGGFDSRSFAEARWDGRRFDSVTCSGESNGTAGPVVRQRGNPTARALLDNLGAASKGLAPHAERKAIAVPTARTASALSSVSPAKMRTQETAFADVQAEHQHETNLPNETPIQPSPKADLGSGRGAVS